MKHIVLWRPKASTAAAQMGAALAELDTIASVPGLLGIRSTPNLAIDRPSAHGYSHCTVFAFDDPEAVSIYRSSPANLAWVDRFLRGPDAIIEDVLSLDIPAEITELSA